MKNILLCLGAIFIFGCSASPAQLAKEKADHDAYEKREETVKAMTPALPPKKELYKLIRSHIDGNFTIVNIEASNIHDKNIWQEPEWSLEVDVKGAIYHFGDMVIFNSHGKLYDGFYDGKPVKIIDQMEQNEDSEDINIDVDGFVKTIVEISRGYKCELEHVEHVDPIKALSIYLKSLKEVKK